MMCIFLFSKKFDFSRVQIFYSKKFDFSRVQKASKKMQMVMKTDSAISKVE